MEAVKGFEGLFPCLFWTHPKIRQSGEAVASEVGIAATAKVMNILRTIP